MDHWADYRSACAAAEKFLAGRKVEDLSDADLTTYEGHLEKMNDAKAKAEKADADRRASIIESAREHASTTPPAPGGPRSEFPRGAVTKVKDAWEDDPNRGFKTIQHQLLAVYEVMGEGRKCPPNLASLSVRAQGAKYYQAAVGSDEQSTFSDPYGGFLLAPGLSPNIRQIQAEADPTAGRTTPVPMSAPMVPIAARVDKNHTTSVSGGLRFYRRAEADTVSASRMEFERVEVKVNGLLGLAFATEELLQDSPISIMPILEAGFRDELGATILNEKLHGNGVGKYEGILNSPCLVTIADRDNNTQISGGDILDIRARVWNYSRAIWLANHDTYQQLAAAHVAGTNADVFLFSPARGEDVPDMLLGRPIFFTEFASTLGTAGDLICGVWSEYLEGSLGTLDAQESVHVRFVNLERCFRFWVRNDGRCWWRSALTPKKSSTTLSPFVTLPA